MSARPLRFGPFEDARFHVWTLGIKTQREWQQFCRSGKRPSDIPASPDKVYKYLGWVSWGDWLVGLALLVEGMGNMKRGVLMKMPGPLFGH